MATGKCKGGDIDDSEDEAKAESLHLIIKLIAMICTINTLKMIIKHYKKTPMKRKNRTHFPEITSGAA